MDPSSSNSSSELRILLLGPKLEEKSSAGNTILDKKEFYLKTLQCVEKHSERAGKKITVVDTPGWWGNLPFEENPELYKQEIILSVTKCPPGPHVLLLVLNVDTPFKENEKDILCGNMKCFGHEVWRHTIVLFTCEDHHTSTQQFIENENLQWLIEKCGNRYHVLNTKNCSDGSQVTELLEKIEQMVTANRGQHYEIDRETLQCVEEKRKAEKRRMKIQQLEYETENVMVGRTDPLPSRRARSMDIPLNVAEVCDPSSGSSAYVSMSVSSKETPEKLNFSKSLCSQMTSGWESLNSIPDSDKEPDVE